MRLFNRKIKAAALPKKIFSALGASIRVFTICKNPFFVLSCYIKGKTADCFVLRDGLKIHLSTNLNDVATFIVIFCKNEYGNLRNKKTIVDIGGNIGMFAMYALHCGAQNVYSFEPNIEAYKTICKNIQANNLGHRWKAYNTGVAATGGGFIFIPKNSSPTNIAVTSTNNQQAFDKVPTTSINDFVPEEGLHHIDLLKVDCEGAEYEIMPSLKPAVVDIIAEIKMEYHSGPAPLMAWLEQYGFTITRTAHSSYNPKLGYIWAVKAATT